MGSFFGSEPSSTQTTTNTQSIPDWQQPYVQNYMASAQNLQAQLPTYTPSANTTAGINQLTGAANNDTTATNANAALNKTLQGNYLYGNPGFNAAYQAASDQILPQVNAGFTNAGQYGDSSGRQVAQTQALGNIWANMYQQNQQNQLNAIGMSPNVQNSLYVPAQQTLAAGNLQDQIARQPYQDQWNALNMEGNASKGAYGGTSTNNTPVYTNTGASALGLAGMLSDFL